MRKIIQLLVLLLIIGFIVTSCEGPKDFSITVIDKITKKPIDSVFVKVKVKAGNNDKSDYNLQGYTDSTGKFVRSEMIGYGLSMSHWDFYMDYDKKGYAHKSELNRVEGTVELEH
jgi:hypothetical protein